MVDGALARVLLDDREEVAEQPALERGEVGALVDGAWRRPAPSTTSTGGAATASDPPAAQADREAARGGEDPAGASGRQGTVASLRIGGRPRALPVAAT